MPASWLGDAPARSLELAGPDSSSELGFVLTAKEADPGDIRGFDVVLRGGSGERRVAAQVLVANAPLVREAEEADELTGDVRPSPLAEASGQRVLTFTGAGTAAFDLTVSQAGTYALWLRARWDGRRGARMALTVDQGQARDLRIGAMIGFTDWSDPDRAFTKMFSAFGEQFGHWSWYRISNIELEAGDHRLALGAAAGASFDALVLLPQNAVMDRAAMNLFQNWNFAPWQNPM